MLAQVLVSVVVVAAIAGWALPRLLAKQVERDVWRSRRPDA